nr:Chain C, PHE-GLY-ASN-TRP-THR-THR [Aggregatibacter aphrophilus]8P0Q_D Chain D, PHE-GLY-ASN-TRP-THR-THR [Aggregatibacter aphrophilus]
FGNWTT